MYLGKILMEYIPDVESLSCVALLCSLRGGLEKRTSSPMATRSPWKDGDTALAADWSVHAGVHCPFCILTLFYTPNG